MKYFSLITKQFCFTLIFSLNLVFRVVAQVEINCEYFNTIMGGTSYISDKIKQMEILHSNPKLTINNDSIYEDSSKKILYYSSYNSSENMALKGFPFTLKYFETTIRTTYTSIFSYENIKKVRALSVIYNLPISLNERELSLIYSEIKKGLKSNCKLNLRSENALIMYDSAGNKTNKNWYCHKKLDSKTTFNMIMAKDYELNHYILLFEVSQEIENNLQ